jgi:hypothetical protein
MGPYSVTLAACYSIKRQEAEIQNFLRPAEANLGYCLAWFSLSSCPQHSLEALLLQNPTCLLKYLLTCEQNLSLFIFRCGLSGIRISEGLLYLRFKLDIH